MKPPPSQVFSLGRAPAVERRQHPRFRIQCAIRLKIPGGPHLTASATDVSSGGFFFVSRQAIAADTKVECDLEIPDGTATPFVLHAEAVVVRLQSIEPGSFGIACRLLDYSVLPAG
ncbi:MAG: PilZ domain-containing protein [Acidobacteriota bacterium]